MCKNRWKWHQHKKHVVPTIDKSISDAPYSLVSAALHWNEMSEKKYDSNALWVALSEFGEGNIFAVYPKLLAQLLLEEEAARKAGDTSEAEKLVLPSDKEWRLKQYFYLVELQKTLDEKQVSVPEIGGSSCSQGSSSYLKIKKRS